jgi:hypothetical protein
MDPITLSVDAAVLEHMRVDEGSLRIKARARSEQRIPLARLQRVDITGSPEGVIECLLELAARSIAVTFFRRGGGVQAQLFHPQPRVTALSHWTTELFSVHGESPAYRRWRENHVRAVFAASGIRGGSLEQQDLEHGQRYAASLARAGLSDVAAELAGIQDGLIDARVGEHLVRAGVCPGGPAHARLARDLRALTLRWMAGKTLHWVLSLGANADAPEFRRYMLALADIALDEWLYLVVGRLTEVAASGALHRDVLGDTP